MRPLPELKLVSKPVDVEARIWRRVRGRRGREKGREKGMVRRGTGIKMEKGMVRSGTGIKMSLEGEQTMYTCSYRKYEEVWK